MTSNPLDGQAPGPPAGHLQAARLRQRPCPPGTVAGPAVLQPPSVSRRYHNDARESPSGLRRRRAAPPTRWRELDAVIRQAAALARAAATRPPAWIRPGSGHSSPRPRPSGARAEAAAVTAEARAGEAAAEAQALAEALEAAREDVRAAQAGEAAAPPQAPGCRGRATGAPTATPPSQIAARPAESSQPGRRSAGRRRPLP